MAAIQDHAYVKICAELASVLGISLASARRRVDQTAAKEGTKDPIRRRELAQEMLDEANREANTSECLDALLSSTEGDGNFLLED